MQQVTRGIEGERGMKEKGVEGREDSGWFRLEGGRE
jgi:hypothetical protein